MSDESKPTLGAIYAAWRAVGADVAGLDWAKFVWHIAVQTPSRGGCRPASPGLHPGQPEPDPALLQAALVACGRHELRAPRV